MLLYLEFNVHVQVPYEVYQAIYHFVLVNSNRHKQYIDLTLLNKSHG